MSTTVDYARQGTCYRPDRRERTVESEQHSPFGLKKNDRFVP
jgi:hypothetical protein